VTDEKQALRLEARRAGLVHVLETHGEELEKARASAERLISDIPRGLHMYDEPARFPIPFDINPLPSATS